MTAKRERTFKPDWQLNIAKERIERLLNLSREESVKDVEKGKRYVRLARRVGTRYNIRLSKGQKKVFCKHCSTILIPGKTMSVRVVNGSPVRKCSVCGTKLVKKLI